MRPDSVRWYRRLFPGAPTGRVLPHSLGLLLAVAIPAAAHSAECDPTWTRIATHGPSAREYAGLAPHASASGLLLFGGRDAMGALSDTWLWSDGSWSRMDPAELPPARWGHAMCAKTAGRVAVFGGRDPAGYLNDLWYWDGAWNGPYTPGPSARVNTAMANDSARDRIVVFGGCTEGGAAADTWESRVANWRIWDQQSPPASPPARSYHAMAFDPNRGRVVLFGGLSGANQKLGDTWEWDGTAWTRVNAAGPARYAHAMWYDGARNRVVLFGGIGITGTRLSDAWEWNGASWSLLGAPTGPSARHGGAAAFDATAGQAVLFGGNDGTGPRGDAWGYDGVPSQWSFLCLSGPGARHSASAAFDSARGVTVVYGGIDADRQVMSHETWEWNGVDWKRAAVSGISACTGTAMAYDSIRGLTVLYGGATGYYWYSHTLEWNGSSWTGRDVSGPGNRYHHAMAFDAFRGVTVLFGGDPSANSGDTWEYDGTAWARREVAGPGGRFYHAMAYDSERRVVVLFGGSSESFTQYRGDTWEWDGAAWTRKSITGPGARVYARMVYDTVRKRVVLYGGADEEGPRTDTWEWDGTVWREVGVNDPGYRTTGAGMVYDTVRHQTVLFGGLGPAMQWHNDTWVRNSPSLIWFFGQPVAATRNVGESAVFSVTAFGGGTRSYRWRRNGIDLDDAPTRTGTHTQTLRIDPVGTLDAGLYDVRVFNECEQVYSHAVTLTVPLHRDDAVRALRIASGTVAATTEDRARLDVVGGASAGKVDVRDAIALLRSALAP